eukprot:TRINITY_DN33638_c0_g1_i1.p1 TRINITY_DN33638_c0_g1~~TRINITY_DN33638_c0_g1_i1.p1  ORF type:complete len:269 (+),score=74.12 TRINITY_DN33638_c0_g1_i1:109-915(+)
MQNSPPFQRAAAAARRNEPIDDITISELCHMRQTARRSHDFENADRLRDALMRWGVRWHDEDRRWICGQRNGTWGEGVYTPSLYATGAMPDPGLHRPKPGHHSSLKDESRGKWHGSGSGGSGSAGGAPEPEDPTVLAAPPPAKRKRGAEGEDRGPPPGGNWVCEQCQRWNKSEFHRQECQYCYAPRPGYEKLLAKLRASTAFADRQCGLDSGRSYKGGGSVSAGKLQEDALAADQQRRQRLEAERAAAEKRKKDKTRCATCKRFACIC